VPIGDAVGTGTIVAVKVTLAPAMAAGADEVSVFVVAMSGVNEVVADTLPA
jgi:hypothetical protein